MLTRRLYHLLIKTFTKYLFLVACTITLVFPLVPGEVSLPPPAFAQTQPIPKEKILAHHLESDSPSWAKGIITTSTLASTEIFTTYMPIVFVYRPPIVNGDFEMGRANSDLIIGPDGLGPASTNPPLNWTRFSRLGYELFFTQSSRPIRLPIPAQNGSWATWLGGDDYEISSIHQQVTIPRSSPFLVFSYWIHSYDHFCGSQLFTLPELLTDFVAGSPVGGLPVDTGGVVIDNNSGVLGVAITDLCTLSQTNGWTSITFNLNQYAGQTVRIYLRTKSDSVLTSSFFIDNVSLGGTALTSTSSFTPLSVIAKPSQSSEPSNHTHLFNSSESESKSMLVTPSSETDITKKGTALPGD